MSTNKQTPVCTTRFPLNNGSSIPAVGLGTWQGQYGTNEEDTLKTSIIHALKSGYRLIDTAQYYGIEPVVGAAIRDSGVPRSEITLITKFWGTRFSDPAGALAESVRNLDVGYVDLLLMHWPAAMTADEKPMRYPGSPPFWEAWKAMEGLVGDKCRAIGVSNFTPKLLDKLLETAKVVPAVNQVELHALNPNHKLVPYCKEKGIVPISWSTMGSERHESGKNPILTHELFTGIAKKHGCSAGVVSLSWAVQRGVVVIPKSSKASRIEENIRLVQLSEEEMKTIDGAGEKIGTMRLSDTIPGLQYTLDGQETVLGWTKQEFGWEDEKGNWLC